ncbi:unnamed protein product [Durusdinium trenchii]|uniref:Ubiquitin-like domain-containing protein n=1 Tax=Durusdinium trenchii TaxID=1381693 RepID=A0ABP0SL99_9DINO
MKIVVRQISGQVAEIDVRPDATLKELKRHLRSSILCDQLTRQLATIEVVLGVSKLEDDEATVAELGINAGTEVQVLFSILPGPKLTLETFLSCLFVCSWLKPTLAD